MLTAIVDTLKTEHAAYKKWAVTRFVSSLLWRGIHADDQVFFSTEIDKLRISYPLKKSLEKFGLPDVGAIMQLAQRQAIKQPQLFTLVVATQAILVREEIAAQAKKERRIADN